MTRITQVRNQNGETVSAIPLDFDISREEWNEYKLLDNGGKVRVKVTVLRLLHQCDDDGAAQYHADGSPVMIVNHKVDVVPEF